MLAKPGEARGAPRGMIVLKCGVESVKAGGARVRRLTKRAASCCGRFGEQTDLSNRRVAAWDGCVAEVERKRAVDVSPRSLRGNSKVQVPNSKQVRRTKVGKD